MPYDGLCSHQCLYETPQGELDLTPEQLEVKAVDDERRFRELKAINATNYHFKQMADNYDEYITNSHDRVKKSRATNPTQHRKTEQKRKKKALEDNTHYCSTCDLSFTTKHSFDDHMKSPKHLRKVNNTHKRFCNACNLGYDNKSNYNRHLKNERHQKSVARLAEEAAKGSAELS